MTLTPEELPKADPWNSYYAVRFAWGDATSDLFRSVGQGVATTDAKRVEAPLFFEVRSPQTRTAILTGGLPYHRRVGMRMFDALLVSRGETATSFRLGIAVDCDHPALEAQAFVSPTPVVADPGPAPKAVPSCWFFHVDAKNVMATSWEPVTEEGQVVGYRVRLLETEGKSGAVKLRSFRSVAKARQTDLLGNTLAGLAAEGDTVKIDMTGHEWAQVEVRLNW
jgi:alpha-mannosidase